MTRLLLDVASYQGGLLPADVKAAGFSAVNLKVSHGLSRKSVHPNVTGWVDQAKALGLGLSTFHYMTGDATGLEQARYAYARITDLGLHEGAAHQLDVESTPAPTLAMVREYLTEMTRLLGRPVALYTGDWWWQPRGWNVSDLTPYVWSAPNKGYLGGYPGDTSTHWRAGWGGWANLAIMQYAVAPLTLPGGKSGTIDVSMSAIRDESVWRALTERRVTAMSAWTVIPCLLTLRDEFNSLNRDRDKGADGTIGDTSHTSASDHTPDEDSAILRDHDADSKNEVHALDIDSTGPWPRSFDSIIKGIIARERARWLDANDKCRLKYVIWNKRIYSTGNDFAGEAYTGSDPHTNHAHFSGRYETVCENDTRPWGVAATTAPAPTSPQEDDMPSADEVADAVIAKLKAQAGKDALYAGVNQDRVQAYTTNPDTGAQTVRTPTEADNGFMTWASALAFGVRNGDFARVSLVSAHRKIEAQTAEIKALKERLEAAEASILAAVQATKA